MLRLLSRLTSRLFRRRLFRLFQLKLLGPLFVFVLRLAFLLLVIVPFGSGTSPLAFLPLGSSPASSCLRLLLGLVESSPASLSCSFEDFTFGLGEVLGLPLLLALPFGFPLGAFLLAGLFSTGKSSFSSFSDTWVSPGPGPAHALPQQLAKLQLRSRERPPCRERV